MMARISVESQASDIRVSECVVAIYRAEPFTGLTRFEVLAALARIQADVIKGARREELSE